MADCGPDSFRARQKPSVPERVSLRILLTGATGFIGSAFLRTALSRGHPVLALLGQGRDRPASWPESSDLMEIRGRLNDVSWSEVARLQPDVCVHTAWITTPGIYLESAENKRWSTDSFAFFCRASEAGVRHWVSLGTCIEYRPGNEPLSEARTPVAPATTYARCKNDLREALATEASRQKATFCWARVFYPYGPGEHRDRLCSSIIRKLRSGEQVVLNTPQSTKDYIFIDDLADALQTVIERRCEGPINLGTGAGVTVKQIADIAGEKIGRPDLIVVADPPRQDPLGNLVADASRLRATGWSPKVGITDGITRLVNGAADDSRAANGDRVVEPLFSGEESRD